MDVDCRGRVGGYVHVYDGWVRCGTWDNDERLCRKTKVVMRISERDVGA